MINLSPHYLQNQIFTFQLQILISDSSNILKEATFFSLSEPRGCSTYTIVTLGSTFELHISIL